MSLKLIIKAGIPMSEGFLMLSEDERDLGRKTLLKDIYRQLDTGEPLYISMKSTVAFPKYMTDMVEIGERTGKLEDVFGSLTGYYVQQEQISKNIKNAVLYPAILLIIMLFVIIVLVTEILPVFHDVYTQLGSTMPAAATAIMNFGIALSQYWYIFGILLVPVSYTHLCGHFL